MYVFAHFLLSLCNDTVFYTDKACLLFSRIMSSTAVSALHSCYTSSIVVVGSDLTIIFVLFLYYFIFLLSSTSSHGLSLKTAIKWLWFVVSFYASSSLDSEEAQFSWPIHPSVCSFIVFLLRYQSCEHDILIMNELILLRIGTSGLWGDRMNQSTFGSRGQRLRSHDAKVRFEA